MPFAWLSMDRSEEHTSELQSRLHLVCRLLLEKKQAAAAGEVHSAPGTTGPPHLTRRGTPAMESVPAPEGSRLLADRHSRSAWESLHLLVSSHRWNFRSEHKLHDVSHELNYYRARASPACDSRTVCIGSVAQCKLSFVFSSYCFLTGNGIFFFGTGPHAPTPPVSPFGGIAR